MCGEAADVNDNIRMKEWKESLLNDILNSTILVKFLISMNGDY